MQSLRPGHPARPHAVGDVIVGPLGAPAGRGLATPSRSILTPTPSEDLLWAKEILCWARRPTATRSWILHLTMTLTGPSPVCTMRPHRSWPNWYSTGAHNRTCSTGASEGAHQQDSRRRDSLLLQDSAGSLPLAARWLTRARLCWQRKKNGKPRPIKMGCCDRPTPKQLVNQHQDWSIGHR